MAKKTKTPRLIYPIGEKSVNQVIAERTIKHQAFLQQFANSEIVKIDALLLDAESDILAQMARRMAKITKRGRDIGPVTTRRLVEMFQSFSQITRTSTQEMYNLLKGDLIDLSYDEVDALQDVFDKSAPITLEMQLPSPATLRAIVVTEPFEGKVMRKWFSEIGQNTQRGLEQSVRMGMTQGETIDQIASRIRGVYGRTNHQGIRNEAARTARTAVNHVSTEARHATFESNADLIKGFQWHSTLDRSTCLICGRVDGRVFKLEAPRRPPEHFNCLTGDSLITASDRVTSVSKRWYDGDLIVLRTAAGNMLSCTPNHPILTDAGWMAAHLLNVGSHVISHVHSEGISSRDSDNKQRPTPIHEIAESFLNDPQVSAEPVPTAPEDFHGDGKGSQVAVIGTNGLLGDTLDTPIQEEIVEPLLMPRRDPANLLMGESEFDFRSLRASAAPHSSMCCIGKFCALLGGELRQADRVLLPSGTKSNASFTQNAVDDSAADVALEREIRDGATGEVFLDKIVAIEIRQFSGHVYNLQTEKSWYAASNIINHNCRCTITPLLKPWRELGVDRDDLTPKQRASMNGQVSGTLTYEQWFKSSELDASDRRRILGPTRYNRWKAGKEDIKQFTNSGGKIHTIEHLQDLEKRREKAKMIPRRRAAQKKARK